MEETKDRDDRPCEPAVRDLAQSVGIKGLACICGRSSSTKQHRHTYLPVDCGTEWLVLVGAAHDLEGLSEGEVTMNDVRYHPLPLRGSCQLLVVLQGPGATSRR